jgi:hypothetical protein
MSVEFVQRIKLGRWTPLYEQTVETRFPQIHKKLVRHSINEPRQRLSVDLIVVLKTRSKTTMDDAITATTQRWTPITQVARTVTV